jgi:ketosteroid isomerase-like protein
MTERKYDIEEEAIIAMLMMRAKAIGEKDAKEALSFDTDDCVVFSLAPPLVYHGKSEAGLRAWFDTWDGPIGGDVQDAKVTIGTDVAFWSGLIRMTGAKTDGEVVDLWFRQTLGLVNGKAAGLFHTSMPQCRSQWMGAVVLC